jgi:hypothetical protein
MISAKGITNCSSQANSCGIAPTTSRSFFSAVWATFDAVQYLSIRQLSKLPNTVRPATATAQDVANFFGPRADFGRAAIGQAPCLVRTVPAG